MTTLTDIRQAVDANANDSRNSYWSACETLARGDITGKQREVALKKAVKAAQDIGSDAEQIDADVNLLRERETLPDIGQMKRDTDNEARQLIDEAASLEAQAAAATARATELGQDAAARRSNASVTRNNVNLLVQRMQSLTATLVKRGFPSAVAERDAEQRQREFDGAQHVVREAERELAESVAALNAANADPKRQTHGGDRIAAHVQRRKRDFDTATRKLRELEAT
jgi:hypothetical protein